MDTTATPSRRVRADSPHRRRSQAHLRNQQQQRIAQEKPQARFRDSSHDSSLASDKRQGQGVAMTRDHRYYHRRQAEGATRIVTVNVEVVATVDSSGNVVGQETRTQDGSILPTPGPVLDPIASLIPSVVDVLNSVAAPAVSAVVNVVDGLVPSGAVLPEVPSVPPVPPPPAVPPVPSLPQVPSVPQLPTVPIPVLPSVPSVPPFPSDLTVPPYPWPSGVSAEVAQASTPASLSPAPTSVSGSSPIPTPISAAPGPVSNSTIVSIQSSSSGASLISQGSSSPSTLGSSAASAATTHRISSSDSEETTSSRTGTGTATSSSRAGDGTYYNTAGGGAANTAAAPGATNTAVGAGAGNNSTPLGKPQVAGSVVGSLAGAALLLALLLFLLRRHKRKRKGALQLTGDETTERAQPMTQDARRSNRIPSTFLNRFSGMSRSTADTSTSGGERSFQRVSGRKLPSAFSEGMVSEQFSRGGTMSGASFYQDDHGTYGGPGMSKEYGGPGMSKEFGKEIGMTAGAGTMNIRPSPARTPIIRHPDDDTNPFADPTPFPRTRSHLSPPQSPNPDAPRNTLGRSLQSADGSRSSKFTENV